MKEESSPILRFGRWLGAILFVIAGPISGYFLLQIYLTARASEAWPTVSGEITKADVAITAVGRYHADVEYTYNVRGRDLVGNRIRASDGEFDFPGGAEQTIRGLEPGQRVEVHYDPTDPARSVIRTGAHFQEYALLLVPVVIFSLGVAKIAKLNRP